MAGPNRGMPATHCYTQADLRPTLKDPRCNPNFPLAAYWPVYLGNFWCDVYTQRTERIQEYFGSKGLLVRMVFSRSGACDPFLKEQKRCQCYDFLVYFVSQQDAHDAVYYCNRDMYYGHRLNVLPGRIPVPFDVSKSVHHTLLEYKKPKVTEQVFERYINEDHGVEISHVARHSAKDYLVQYLTVKNRNKVIRNCQIAVPGLISKSQTKQRFLEKHVELEIVMWFQANPEVMDMVPPNNIMQALSSGFTTGINQSWQIGVEPHPPLTHYTDKSKSLRKHHNQCIRNQAKNLFGLVCEFKHRGSVPKGVITKGVQKRIGKRKAQKARLLKRQLQNAAGGQPGLLN